jgi:AraC family transcriptional regulator, ethanolamine operon transcriptional activator
MNSGQSNQLDRTAIEGTYTPETVSWVQLGAGPFEVRFGVVAAGLLDISRRDYNIGFSVSADVAPKKVMIGLLGDSRTHSRWFGTEVDESSIAASRTTIELIADGAGSNYTLSVDEPELQRQFPRSPDALGLLENVRDVQVARDPLNATRVRYLLDKLFFAGSDSPLSGGGNPASKSIYGTLIPLLCSTMKRTDSQTVEPSCHFTRRAKAVHKCEAYLRENLDATITLLDLSEVSGMESRSLINAFEAVTGLSPMHYLRRLRLSGVRRALQLADRAQTRVTDVATNWGFWHLGHFSTSYYAMFGETPSQTLTHR